MLASYRQNKMTNTVQKMVTQLTIINSEFTQVLDRNGDKAFIPVIHKYEEHLNTNQYNIKTKFHSINSVSTPGRNPSTHGPENVSSFLLF